VRRAGTAAFTNACVLPFVVSLALGAFAAPMAAVRAMQTRQQAEVPQVAPPQAAPPQSAAAVASSATEVEAGLLAPFQRELLDLAFDSASAIPLAPHLKSRSRSQDLVIAACLELNQPQLALDWIPRINNWRRGIAYADVAFHQARCGQAEDARRSLQLASAMLAGPFGASEGEGQDWQRDKLRARIAETCLALGDEAEALRVGAGVVDTALVGLAAEWAAPVTAASLDGCMSTLDTAFQSGDPVRGRGALAACVRIYGQVFADAVLRERVEAGARSGQEKQPLSVQMDTLQGLAEAALAHADRSTAVRFLDEAQALLAGGTAAADQRIDRQARLAELRGRAGDETGARTLLDASLALFDAESEAIPGTERADVLRPLAETMHALGDVEASLTLYRRVLKAGAANPNARPRAEDLAATCCSLARTGLEPDAAMHTYIVKLRKRLQAPW